MKKLSEYLITEEQVKNWEDDEQYMDELVLKLENALAEELIAFYQYTMAWPFIHGKERNKLETVLKDNAKDELEDHAYWLLERLDQLKRQPETIKDIDELNKFAKHKYIIPVVTDVKSIIEDNIKAEQGAIETYLELEEFTRDKDIVTHTKVEEILSDEREHLHLLEQILRDIK